MEKETIDEETIDEETIEGKSKGVWNWDQNYGYVGRLASDSSKVSFTLRDGQTSMNPKWGYYFVPKKPS